jgi:hypothetical protein
MHPSDWRFVHPVAPTAGSISLARVGASDVFTPTRARASDEVTAGCARRAFGISQKWIPRVVPTTARAEDDCGQDVADCDQNAVATSRLLATESAQVT